MTGLSQPAAALPSRFGTRRSRLRRRLTLLFRGRRAIALIELATIVMMIVMAVVAYVTIAASGAPQKPLKPPVVALLLIGNLLPAMVLLVLIARRSARVRAERSGMKGRATLHVRLVALFSAIAALPTLLVAIFSSLLFQYGVEFWFSDRARTVLQNADRVAQTYVDEHKSDLGAEALAMKGDLLNWMNNASPEDPRSSQYFPSQVYYRKLDQAALIEVGLDGRESLIYGANLDARPMEQRLPPALIPELSDDRPHFRARPDQFEAAIAFDRASRTYLWISRHADPLVLAQTGRANTALGEYRTLLARSRILQLQFNLALYLVSLLIVATAIWVALRVADRIVRPIGELVGAARRVAAGDLAARVAPAHRAQDEVGTLAAAFNRMTRRLQEQTGVLESRRALTEAVLSGVTAGVISVDANRLVTIINPSAITLLGTTRADAIGAPLAELAPELFDMLQSGDRQAVIQLAAEGEVRTLAATVGRAGSGYVLTFDDITQQLADQRRAAWSDVARRIAHEIKNPLTPIQLAAERLQRRYGRTIENDDGTFSRLVSTIVRQVGDIRRMIDEFSAFARMPKPSFAEESLVDLARQALFLHEVAHPAIEFRLDAPAEGARMVCDRRQLGQALTNLVKNAVEAIEGRGEDAPDGEVLFTIAEQGEHLVMTVADNGIGLPVERERMTEPYMTTRAKGTGLGLAIVQKIVEDHLGTMSFADRPGGGAIVRLCFEPDALAPLAIAAPHEPQAAAFAAGRH
ncbi:two-component system nitrogen regulation sensor histidine kinase NtrY [Sphingomonas vulcanisoli]|uniref:histidine kinase n=1 Tax=Sphingomonas vulcanisoli TaxID=1658060 RepID=A0ABX0TR34_9SPHN|nr:PAS domain-containing sensor histidine kinase [Sphingomonas vulcanisoli]NIJ06615.1 two-component system nitrogen regulation sensor histidine kinase NtrY [Sphingomonas vulcanisoli]